MKKDRLDGIYDICQNCGQRFSDRQFEISTWHEGKCDICKKEAMLTEPRDFFYIPKFDRRNIRKG